ncbi:hypothetical protein BKA62DRAFT_702814 [Auriculariales sp. MPI-PUGE-AT-0066]|nr:hypothetical protein BKA62DRAFT_702814 [Auriculariales sp. MPI-PUGE-AT-0066]
MRFSAFFFATAAVYFSTSVSAAAINLDARKKCDAATTVTVTVTAGAPTQTESSSAPSEPTSTGVPPAPGKGGAFDASSFFPVPYKQAFSTLPSDIVGGNVTHVDMSLDALSASSISKGVTEDVVDAPGAPSGVKAFQAKYPKGSYNPSGTPRGGFGFYLGDPVGTDFKFESATEIVYSYAVYFPDNWDWVKGGKIPGPYGGATMEDAHGCSGGRQEGRDKCFSLRMMWRKDGMGEIYAYVPQVKENEDAFMALPGTVKDAAYGFSVARGAFTFPKGAWTVLAERVKLNTNGKADGEIELFVNGESKIFAKNVVIRQNADTAFRGGHFQTFFGGSNAEWATQSDVEAYFSGVSASIIA